MVVCRSKGFIARSPKGSVTFNISARGSKHIFTGTKQRLVCFHPNDEHASSPPSTIRLNTAGAPSAALAHLLAAHTAGDAVRPPLGADQSLLLFSCGRMLYRCFRAFRFQWFWNFR